VSLVDSNTVSTWIVAVYIFHDVEVDNGYGTMGHFETIMLGIDWYKHMWLDPFSPRN